MDEAQLLILIMACLDAGIAAWNANPYASTPLPADLAAQRGNQPRQEGAPSTPAIIVVHTGNVPRGFPYRKGYWDNTAQAMKYIHGQRMESTYHVEALVPQSPATPSAMTEADVLNVARYILQNDATIQTLLAQGVFLLRVNSMQSNWIEDDKDQNENVPFFEVTFVYRWTQTVGVPVITDVNLVFDRV
jgi:hypothetical protein